MKAFIIGLLLAMSISNVSAFGDRERAALIGVGAVLVLNQLLDENNDYVQTRYANHRIHNGRHHNKDSFHRRYNNHYEHSYNRHNHRKHYSSHRYDSKPYYRNSYVSNYDNRRRYHREHNRDRW